MDHVRALREIRDRLVGQRRIAAQENQSNDVVRLQSEIDAVDRAIKDEEDTAAKSKGSEPRIRHV